ncbi:MAG: hypothetical protein JO086_06935 [Acidimicrobiia bacterium]|nr:hypothetical protein [Acidimicrobiia bacterium]
MASESSGAPVMLAATSLLRPGPTRIGSLGKHITLPRTIRLAAMVAVGGGAFCGLLVASVITPFLHLRWLLLWLSILGGCVGFVVVSWSPLKGETLFTWAALATKASLGRIQVAGGPGYVVVRKASDPPPAPDAPIVAECGDDDGSGSDHLIAYAVTERVPGPRAKAYIGIAPLASIASGRTTLLRAAVDVEAGSVDHRGRPVRHRARASKV